VLLGVDLRKKENCERERKKENVREREEVRE